MREYGPMLPLNTPSMRKLSERALRLFDEVIETYPRAVEKELGGESKENFEHERDAHLCALTARAFARGEYETYSQGPDCIVIPKG